MEKEEGEENEEYSLVIQNERVSYEDSYVLNRSKNIEIFQMIDVVAGVLGNILNETDKIPDHLQTSFNAKSVPSISVKDYLIRIAKCSKCSTESVLLALIYIDRLTERNEKFMIKSINIHRYVCLLHPSNY